MIERNTIFPTIGRAPLACLLTATILQALDLTIATIALPAIETDLALDPATGSWVLTTYIVATALMTPAAGALSSALGRRRALLLAIGGLTLASAACGAAPNLPFLLAARLAQGAAAGAIMPLVQATLLDMTPKAGHGRAMSYFGVAIMVGPVLGPSLGGVLVDTFGWRSVFFVNLPIGLFAFLGIAWSLADRAEEPRRRIDAAGLVIFGGGIVALQLLLDRAHHLGWFTSGETLAYASLMVAGLACAILRSARRQSAFPSLAPFADRNFSVTTICNFLAGFVIIGSIALVPMLLQTVFGHDATAAGLAMAPRGIGTMVMMLAMSGTVGKIDHRVLLFTGVALNAAALIGLALVTAQSGIAAVAALSLLQGIGFGLIFTPLSTAAFSFLPPAMRADATGLYALLRHVGGSVGVATLAIFLFQSDVPQAQLLAAYHFDFLLLLAVSLAMGAAVILIRTDRAEPATRVDRGTAPSGERPVP
jgi:DHA2 family multidrug resistance protein